MSRRVPRVLGVAVAVLLAPRATSACTPSQLDAAAFATVDRAFETSPYDPAVVRRRAVALEAVCDWEEGFRMWERLLLLTPEDPEVLLRMAHNRVPVSVEQSVALYQQYSTRPGVSLTSDSYCLATERFVDALQDVHADRSSRTLLGWLESVSGKASCDVLRREPPVTLVAERASAPIVVHRAAHRGPVVWGLGALAFALGLFCWSRQVPVRERWTLSRLQQERPELAGVVGVECGWLHHDVLRHGLGGMLAASDALEHGDKDAWPWLRGRLVGEEGVLAQMRRFSTALDAIVRREVDISAARRGFPLLKHVEHVTCALRELVAVRDTSPSERARALRAVAAYIEEHVCPDLVECARRGETCVISTAWLDRLWDRLMRETNYRDCELTLSVVGLVAPVRVRIPPRDLQSTVSNLLRNAADASLRSGEQELKLSVRHARCPATLEPRVHIGVADAEPSGWEHVRQRSHDAKRGLGLIDAIVQRADGVVVLSEDAFGWKWATVDLGVAS